MISEFEGCIRNEGGMCTVRPHHLMLRLLPREQAKMEAFLTKLDARAYLALSHAVPLGLDIDALPRGEEIKLAASQVLEFVKNVQGPLTAEDGVCGFKNDCPQRK